MAHDCVIGVDVGGTRLRLSARDTASRLETPTASVPVPASVDEMVDTITSLATSAANGRTIRSLAVGLPGQVQDFHCIWIPNLRFLDGIALGEMISRRLTAPCYLINDAQATLLAESRAGAARGCRDVVLVAVGTGIGGALLTNGQLVRGAHGCAGSFGWLTFAGTTRDEDHGQWERAGSGLALEDRAREWGGVEELFAAARGGNSTAKRAVEDYGALLGEGIAALASMFDPEIVVFAGGLVDAMDLLCEPITAAVAHHGSPSGSRIPVLAAQLGSGAGLAGVLDWASEHRPGGST